MQTPYTVEHRAFTGTTRDARGNVTQTYADGVSRPVYGWGPPRSDEPTSGAVTALTVDLEVYSPTFEYGSQDRFVVGGNVFEVVGLPTDYDHGPFGYRPGMVIRLKRGQ